MKNSLTEVFSKAFIALSVAGTLIPLLLTNSTLRRWIILGVGSVALAVGLLLYFKSRGHYTAVKAGKNALPEDKRQYVSRIDNKAQLKELWELDQRSYGDENIQFETLLEWWTSCRSGIYILNKGSNIIGALGILPLKDARFDELFEGKSHESEIKPRDLVPLKPGMPHTSWYVSGIVLEGFMRNTRAIKMLLSESIDKWLSEHPFKDHIRLVAIAYSKQGEAMLRRFNFHRYKLGSETITHHPVYLFETHDAGKLMSILDRVR